MKIATGRATLSKRIETMALSERRGKSYQKNLLPKEVDKINIRNKKVGARKNIGDH